MTLSYDADQQRALLELSFEPSGDGFLYFHNRWSRGIPVSAAEREAYLRISALAIGPRRAWRRTIGGRPTTPPRAYGPVRRKIFARMPRSTGAMMAVTGIAGVALGLRAATLLGRVTYVSGGILLLILAILFFTARLGLHRSAPPE